MSAVAFIIPAVAQKNKPVKNIVIVHGAFADASGWDSVYKLLTIAAKLLVE